MNTHNRTHLGLLDTSVVISLGAVSESDLPAYPFISALTLAELSVGPLIAKSHSERETRQLVLQQVESTFDPLPFDSNCARRFGIIASEMRQGGKKSRARGIDAIIAATALANDLPLYTCNTKHFEAITNLEVLPVPSSAKSI